MKLRDAAVYVIGLSVLEGYGIIQVAPWLKPTGGLGRLGFRLFLVNIAMLAIWQIFIYPFFFSPLRDIPGPKGGSIFSGHAFQARFSKPRGEAIRKWMEEIPNDGLLHIRELFNADVLIPTSHENLKAVLSDNTYDYQKQPAAVKLMRKILGDGLILVEGNVHKFQRKHLLPSFQVKVIRDLYPVFWAKSCELVTRMVDDTKLPEAEFGMWCTRVTLDIIGIAGFGRDFDSLRNPEDEFVKQYNLILEPDGAKAFFFVLNLIFPQWLVQSIPFWDVPRLLDSISRNLYSFAHNMSKERRALLNDPKMAKADKEDMKDILSLLVRSNDFTDHELAHQALTMMAAGHETTSSTLSWCVYLLAQNPELQRRVRDEVRGALPSPRAHPAQTVTAADVDALTWLNAVCNETTRLYPTVPLTTRETVKETTLGGRVVPVGTSVYVVPWAINRATRFWGKDAQEFKPERWIGEDGVTVNTTGGSTSNYSQLTFLHGPRSCIGQGFARSELKCLLAAVVGRYEFALSRDEKTYYPAGLVTTKPANGMWIKLKEVPGW